MGLFKRSTKKNAPQETGKQTDSVNCRNCGASILPVTAKKYKGLCAQCAKGNDRTIPKPHIPPSPCIPDQEPSSRRDLYNIFMSSSSNKQKSYLTIVNNSGTVALVKVYGPSSASVEIKNNGSETLVVPSGHYYVKVRYGQADNYNYMRGDEFIIFLSHVTVGLRQVTDGNYRISPISKDDFTRGA
jgi:hypothetical protein